MSDYDRYGDSYTRSREDDRDQWRGGREDSIFSSHRSDRSGRARDDLTSRSERDRTRGGGFEADRNYRDGGSDRSRDRDRGYGPDDNRRGLAIDETSHLIASNKVEGTAVYGRDGERLGSIYNFMVDKYSGRVEYAVMGYGGVLGMGNRYYPLPWRVLTYDTDRGGYRVPLRERDMQDAPSFDRDSEPRFDQDYGRWLYAFYGIPY